MYIYNRYVTRVVGACGYGSVVAALVCLAGLLAAGGTFGASVVLGCLGFSSIVVAACTAAVAIDACF